MAGDISDLNSGECNVKKQSAQILNWTPSGKSVLWLLLSSILVVGSSVHAQLVNSVQNPLQIAVLHWYPANLTTHFQLQLSEICAVTSDGPNIWVAGCVENSQVNKVRASDGTVLGTFSVGRNPFALVFDGANIWSANSMDSTVTKLRASDGARLGTFATGVGPESLAFDGSNIWVANATSNNVTRLRASDGACINPCTFSVGFSPIGVAFDGANIWVANLGDGTVTRLRASDGACVGVCTFNAGDQPHRVVLTASTSGSQTLTPP